MGEILHLNELRRLRSTTNFLDYEPDFIKVLTTNDDLGAVLRAHLIAEHKVRRLIRKHGGDEKTLPKAFIDLITQAQSRSVINSDTASALRGLNELRNEYAHILEYQITMERLGKLLASFRGVTLDMYRESVEDDTDIEGSQEQRFLRFALCAINSDLLDPDFMGS